MNADSIDAYTPRERVARYDRDMAIMHPNRDVMVQAVVDALPFDATTSCDVLDLGMGTGVLADALLESYLALRVTGIDGAAPMLEVARERLADYADRTEFITGDFCDLNAMLPPGFTPTAIISSFALHHVPPELKANVLHSAIERIAPGGWFINADIVIADDAEIETRWQAMRVAGIVERAQGHDDPRFTDAKSTRHFLDTMEAAEGDCPQTLRSELETMRNAGLQHTGVFWQYTREAVYGGFKSG